MECLVPTRTDFKLCQPMVASSKKEYYLYYISFGITHPELESVPKHYLIAFFCKNFKKYAIILLFLNSIYVNAYSRF